MHRVVKSFMEMCGVVWKCVEMHGVVGSFEMCGDAWRCMEL